MLPVVDLDPSASTGHDHMPVDIEAGTDALTTLGQ
jgi:hypothetical protein